MSETPRLLACHAGPTQHLPPGHATPQSWADGCMFLQRAVELETKVPPKALQRACVGDNVVGERQPGTSVSRCRNARPLEPRARRAARVPFIATPTRTAPYAALPQPIATH